MRWTESWTVVVVIVLVTACVFMAVHLKEQKLRQLQQDPTYEYKAPEDSKSGGDVFQILIKYDDYNFRFRQIHTEPESGKVTRRLVHATFCQDYKANLLAGETLVWLKYIDKGDCWDIGPKDFGYKFLRDERDMIELAPNCTNDKEIVCHPDRNIAEFP